MKLRPFSLLALLITLFAANLFAQADSTVDPWKDYRFLMGIWASDPDPTGGKGSFSLTPDLQDKILLRRNHAEYPASGQRPAIVHDDLMTIYHDGLGNTKAFYLDNEGHAIPYSVALAENDSVLVLVSDPNPPMPRFRLTYIKQTKDSIKILFEMAPPDKPEAFKEYLSGTVHREK